MYVKKKLKKDIIILKIEIKEIKDLENIIKE